MFCLFLKKSGFASKLLSFLSCTVFLYCWEKCTWGKTFKSYPEILSPWPFFPTLPIFPGVSVDFLTNKVDWSL